MKPSLRVYFVRHHDGKLTGTLLARGWIDGRAPAVLGATQDEVYAGLTQLVADLVASEAIDPYLWDEQLNARTVTVEVHPLAVVQKRWVIGKDAIPLRLAFAWSKLDSGLAGRGGGFRVVLPRFDWWFILEDLEIAADVLSKAVSSAMLGQAAASLFDFRHLGPESIERWSPPILGRRKRTKKTPETWAAFPTLHAVAEDLVQRARRRRASRSARGRGAQGCSRSGRAASRHRPRRRHP